MGPLLGEPADDKARPFWQGGELGLRWRPPHPGERSALLSASERLGQQAGQERLRAAQQLQAEVERGYLSLAAATAHAQLMRANETLTGRLQAAAQARVSAGAATRLELSVAKLAQLKAGVARLQAEREVEASRCRLAGWTGLDPAAAWRIDAAVLDRVCEAVDPLEAEALAARALKERAELRGLRAEVGAAAAQQARLRWSLLPWPRFVELAYRFGDERTADYVEAGLAFDLFGRGASAPERERAAALVAERQAALRASSQDVRAEILAALQTLRHARETASAAAEAVTVADAAVVDLNTALGAGQADISRVLELARSALQLRRSDVEARLQCHRAQLDLRLALGDPTRALGQVPGQ